jgi:predicted thioesterase
MNYDELVGISRHERVTVDAARSIEFLGEALRVYSTPAMISDVEYATLRLIQSRLSDAESSVGVYVKLDHIGATPIGEQVEITVTVTAVEGRRVDVAAQVRDRVETVGRGCHSRVIIDIDRHAQRVQDKTDALRAADVC